MDKRTFKNKGAKALGMIARKAHTEDLLPLRQKHTNDI